VSEPLELSFECVIESVKTRKSDNSLIITLSLDESAIPQAALLMVAARDGLPLWAELIEQRSKTIGSRWDSDE
jgi:hypothetical protein